MIPGGSLRWLQIGHEPANATQEIQKMTTAKSLAFGLVLSITTLPLLAQGDDVPAAGADSSSPWEHVSGKYDADQDGTVTREEFQQNDLRFARMDRNDDGQLTEADFEGLESRRPGRRGAARTGLVQGADLDGDGAITAEEWASFQGALDVDGDGLVTGEEMRALRDVSRDGQKAGRGGEKSSERLSRFDADENGGLDSAEREAMFKSLDADGDGTISADEVPQRRRGRSERAGRRGPGAGVHLMKAADADQDQQLTAAEWQSFLQTADSNSDGELSQEELESVRPEGAPEQPADRPADAPTLQTQRLESLFTLLDANEDGVIAEDEWPRRRGPRGGRGSRGPRGQ